MKRHSTRRRLDKNAARIAKAVRTSVTTGGPAFNVEHAQIIKPGPEEVVNRQVALHFAERGFDLGAAYLHAKEVVVEPTVRSLYSMPIEDRIELDHIDKYGYGQMKGLSGIDYSDVEDEFQSLSYSCDSGDVSARMGFQLLETGTHDEKYGYGTSVRWKTPEARRLYYLAHREHVIAQVRAYQRLRATWWKEYMAAYARKNRSAFTERTRRNRAAKPEQYKAARKAHYDRNKEKILKYKNEWRRAQKMKTAA